MSGIALQLAINYLLPALVPVIGWLGAEAARLVRARVKNEVLANALTKLGDVVSTVVAELEQTIVRELKLAAADGVLTRAEMDQVRQKATDKVREYLGPNGLVMLGKALNLDPSRVDAFVESKIEASVLRLNLAERQAAAPQALGDFFMSVPMQKQLEAAGKLKK